jgi:uncharacterized membrane protein YkoI
MRRAMILLAGIPLIAAGCASHQREKEENEVEVTLDQLPPAVRDTITRESGGAPVGKIEREDEKGKAVYEAMITKGGKTWEIEIDESGKVLERKVATGKDKED